MWIALSLVSALLLGGYEVLKKLALRGNAVLPVLYVASLAGALAFAPILVLSAVVPDASGVMGLLYMPPMTWHQHALTLVKSGIVGVSWVLSYYAMRYLPITIVSPTHAISPMFTLLGAVTLLGESLSVTQWIGVVVTMTFFWFFSQAGKLESISFFRNRWMLCLYCGMLLSATSGLFDKYLLARVGLPKATMQAWFNIYMLAVLLPFVLLKWWPTRRENRFVFRLAAPLIGLCLAVADFVYFHALSHPDSLVSIVSALRRCSVVVPFAIGAIFLREQHILRKLLFLLGMMLGVALILVSDF
ncbi:MAG: EamA family transporter [Prevotellaceae bacterium]|jgi:transporter family protein|nr:EamA family transporter [Prevotellaceae bacterium]